MLLVGAAAAERIRALPAFPLRGHPAADLAVAPHVGHTSTQLGCGVEDADAVLLAWRGRKQQGGEGAREAADSAACQYVQRTMSQGTAAAGAAEQPALPLTCDPAAHHPVKARQLAATGGAAGAVRHALAVPQGMGCKGPALGRVGAGRCGHKGADRCKACSSLKGQASFSC